MNTASDRSIKGIRSILDDLHYTPMHGKKRVIMFDEAHGLLAPSQEALLKGLEEPPSHIHFIICTTNPEALKDTFKRRCHIYRMDSLTSSKMIKHMKVILKAEKVENYPSEILDKIIEISEGSLGIALKNLDMVIDMKDDIKGAIELLGTTGSSKKEVKELCQGLVNFDLPDDARWRRVKSLLNNMKTDGESARRPILGYLQTCLLTTTKDHEFYAMVMDEFRHNFYDSGKMGLCLACFKACFISEE